MNKKYIIGSVCCKCGERGASSVYDNGCSDIVDSFVSDRPPKDFEPEESIIRTCNNCGYIWLEKPLNNK